MAVPFLEVCQDSDFSLENLPWGVFSVGSNSHIGVALGDYAVSATELQRAGLLSGGQLAGALRGNCFEKESLNDFMSHGPAAWAEARAVLTRLLSSSEGALRDDLGLRGRAIFPRADVTMHLPAFIGDYTDFYASRQHATNVGTMFRGAANALQDNWTHLPVGYHGRSSSIVVSGQQLHRPRGQVLPKRSSTPELRASAAVDFELELACLIGVGNEQGRPIPVDRASEHIFGFVLLNDWSARDIQKWEYVPLGPFNGKNWGTTISPWVVTLPALEAARCAPHQQDPAPLPYLTHSPTAAPSCYDIHLTVDILPAGCSVPTQVTATSSRSLYWTFDQMIAHHTVGGCNLRPGDLLASGTVSGSGPREFGSLLEKTWGATRAWELDTDSGGVTQRGYLQDGDTVTLRGGCVGAGGGRVGFGECSGMLMPAR
ncbi:MAG: hypothetical protein WDW36_001277 [Sanguina aurantia]